MGRDGPAGGPFVVLGRQRRPEFCRLSTDCSCERRGYARWDFACAARKSQPSVLARCLFPIGSGLMAPLTLRPPTAGRSAQLADGRFCASRASNVEFAVGRVPT